MPIYEFECKCGNQFEEIVKFGVTEHKCPKCKSDAYKIFSTAMRYSLKGGGWGNTGYVKVQAPPPVTVLPNGKVVTATPIYGNKPKNK